MPFLLFVRMESKITLKKICEQENQRPKYDSQYQLRLLMPEGGEPLCTLSTSNLIFLIFTYFLSFSC